MNPAAVLKLIDLTSLNDTDNEQVISDLCRKARTPYGAVAAVCVYSRFVVQAAKQAGVPVATVINFPKGEDAADAVAQETRLAVAAGAQEIDVVLPYVAFQRGDVGHAEAVLKACRKACDGRVLKVILESGAFTDMALLRAACELALSCGADFLKTSTGKSAVGATHDAARVLADAVLAHGNRAGIKISGGVRTYAQAVEYAEIVRGVLGEAALTPQRFRFGASALLDDVWARLSGAERKAAQGGY